MSAANPFRYTEEKFADELEELCSRYDIPASMVCGILAMQIRMIQDAAKEANERITKSISRR